MRYEKFEDVPVWQKAIDLSVEVFRATEAPVFRGKGDIANQMQRAALSVPNNIAEGFERGTTPELIMFLYYAKGSAGEVRSICHVLDRLPAFVDLKSEMSNLKSISESVSRQVSGWARSLQDSDIKGPRHLTSQSKNAYDQKRRASAFMERLKVEHEERLNEMARRRGAAQPPAEPEP